MSVLGRQVVFMNERFVKKKTSAVCWFVDVQFFQNIKSQQIVLLHPIKVTRILKDLLSGEWVKEFLNCTLL